MPEDEQKLRFYREKLHSLMNYEIVNSSDKQKQQLVLKQLRKLQASLNSYPPNSPEAYELLNMVETSILVIKQALERFFSYQGQIPDSVFVITSKN